MVCKKCLAEFLGSFMFMFAGLAAIAVETTTGALGHVGVALTFAFGLMVSIYALGHVSGGHFNPAVTIGLWSAGKHKKEEVLKYLVAQCLGAVAAAVLVMCCFGASGVAAGVTQPSVMTSTAFVLELVMAFFLVFVISGVATDARAASGFAGLAIGGTLLTNALFGGPLTGGSFNPARSLGPALVSGNFNMLWLYIAAPLLGGILAAKVYCLLQDKKKKK